MKLIILITLVTSNAWAGQVKCVAKCVRYSKTFKDVIIPIKGQDTTDVPLEQVLDDKSNALRDLREQCKKIGGTDIVSGFMTEKYRNATVPNGEHVVSVKTFDADANCATYTSPHDRTYEAKDKSLLIPVKDGATADED